MKTITDDQRILISNTLTELEEAKEALQDSKESDEMAYHLGVLFGLAKRLEKITAGVMQIIEGYVPNEK